MAACAVAVHWDGCGREQTTLRDSAMEIPFHSPRFLSQRRSSCSESARQYFLLYLRPRDKLCRWLKDFPRRDRSLPCQDGSRLRAAPHIPSRAALSPAPWRNADRRCSDKDLHTPASWLQFSCATRLCFVAHLYQV